MVTPGQAYGHRESRSFDCVRLGNFKFTGDWLFSNHGSSMSHVSDTFM
jgi:hypothetical protein